MNGSKFYRLQNVGSRTAELVIDGEIGELSERESVSSKQFALDLKNLGDVQTIQISINSPGGSVWDGFKIYNILLAHKARKTVTIDPVAASIASVVAMAGDEINMPENALMMIHEPTAGVLGSANEMRSMAEALDRVTGGILSAYRRRAKLSDETLREMMRKETWISPDEAVEWGFADNVRGSAKLAACSKFKWSKFHYVHPPSKLTSSRVASLRSVNIQASFYRIDQTISRIRARQVQGQTL